MNRQSPQLMSSDNGKVKYSFLTYFFWWCSGAIIPILEKCPTEKNKYVGIGAAIFFTWMLATFSGIFAFHTIFKTLLIAVPVGLVYGLIIFNLDRFITSSMKKAGNEADVFLMYEKISLFFYNELLPAIPRIFIAILIGLAISKPLELELFSVEIDKQLEADYETQVNEYATLLRRIDEERKSELKQELGVLEGKLAESQREIDTKTHTLNAEINGEISGYRGYNIRAERLDTLVQIAHRERIALKKEMSEKKEELDRMSAARQEKLAAYELEQQEKRGFFDRINALSNLLGKPENTSIWWSNFIIICLIVLIETAPVIVKLISSRGPYDAELEYENKKYMLARDKEIRRIKYDKSK